MTTAHVLRESTEQRIRNQIGRVIRGTFGAEEGLRTLVELATAQMHTSGMSRVAIRAVLARLVNEHPDAPAATARGAEARVQELTARVLRWSDGMRGARASA